MNVELSGDAARFLAEAEPLLLADGSSGSSAMTAPSSPAPCVRLRTTSCSPSRTRSAHSTRS
jgi:hypothetical protein